MYLTMARQAVLPVVFTVILKELGALNLVWLSLVLSEMPCIPFAAHLWRGARSNLGSYGRFE